MRRYGYGVVAAATIVFALLMAGAAQAATAVLTYGSPGGTPVPVGDVLTASLKSGTVARFVDKNNSNNYLTCSMSTITITVTSNPIAPGTASGSLSGWTFGSCTPHITGITRVNGVTVDHLPYVIAFGSNSTVTVTGGAAGPIQFTFSFATLLGNIACVYQANGNTLTAITSNVDSSLTFSNQQFTKSSGPSTCFATMLFSAAYGPLTGPGGPVFIN